MADFCKGCTEELFGPGNDNDMQGLVTAEQFAGGHAALSLCEGCGAVTFDHLGNAVEADTVNGNWVPRPPRDLMLKGAMRYRVAEPLREALLGLADCRPEYDRLLCELMADLRQRLNIQDKKRYLIVISTDHDFWNITRMH